ncbi:peptidoglycan-binding protein [Streptomyces sp. NPDC053367]|uniref:peptidoglycan-binding protein n=1 Tax=Streptomyces sp. NPDC053367 TaxID=3365700 RepID=UPI0037D0EC3F
MSVKTGPQRYPGSSRANWYQDDFPGDPMEVNVVVLHTTEGPSLPGYGGGGSAPNLTAVPDFHAKRLRWFQHFDIEVSSRALQNLKGGVETNTLNVCQVELVGTCDPKTHRKWDKAGQRHVFWPEAPEWALEGVARFLSWMHEEHGVPLTGPKSWPAFPQSFGNGRKQRMTASKWGKFEGVCGHMHVPENDHGDPGAIDFAEILRRAKADLDLEEPPADTTPGRPGRPKIPAFPGRKFFRDGAVNDHVLKLGKQLVKRGFGDHYKVGPGRNWSEADRLNVRDFQKSRPELRGDADGFPGPLTWKLLFS